MKTAKLNHQLKILDKYFKDVTSGAKKAEYRKFDRDYQVNDLILLNEINENVECTGRAALIKITHILTDYLPNGYCMLSFELLDVELETNDYT